MSILETRIADLPREELFLGPKMVEDLAKWGIVTVEDLTKVGWLTDYVLPEDQWGAVSENWRNYLTALADIRNFGPVRLARVRTFLARHGLALADEEAIADYERRGGLIGY